MIMRSLCKKTCTPLSAAPLLIYITFFLAVTIALSQEDLDSYSPGALPIGLGQSGAVEIYDPTALYWNPAGIAVNKNPQGVMSIHEPYYVNFLGYSHFTPKHGTFGMSYGSTSGLKNAVHLGGLGWGNQFAPGFYGGLVASRIQQNDTAWGTIGVGAAIQANKLNSASNTQR